MPAPPPYAASAIDFVTLDQLKTWVEGMTPTVVTADDSVMQFVITAVSQDMLTMMSRPAILSTNYQEWYDGSGSATLALDQAPVNSVTALKVNGVAISPTDTNHVQNGYLISRDKKFIQLVGGGGGLVPGLGFGGRGISSGYLRGCGNVFPQGIANVYADYNAGYATIPDDLIEACFLIIDQDYRRRGWPDKAQIATPQGGGTTSYRSWSIPPRAKEIIGYYTRTYHP